MTTIVFEPLVSVPGVGIGHSIAPAFHTLGTEAGADSIGVSIAPVFTTVGFSPTLGPAAIGIGQSVSPRWRTLGAGTDASSIGVSIAPAFKTYGSGFDIVPDIGVGVSLMPVLITFAETYSYDFDEAASSFPAFLTFGTNATESMGVSRAPPPRTVGRDVPPPTNDVMFLLYQGDGWFGLTVGFTVEEADSAAVAASSLGSDITVQLTTTAAATASLGSKLTGANAVLAAARATDRAQVVFQLVAAAAAVAEDDPAMFLNVLLEAADMVLASGAVTSLLDAYLVVAAMAEIHDRADPIILMSADAAGAVLDAAATTRIGLLAAALESAAATDTAASQWRMTIIANDVGQTTSAIGTSLEGLAAAFDNAEATGIVRFGSDVYAVYAMTLISAAVSEYTDLVFNSQALIDGHLYAASPDGLVMLEGVDDSGVDIDASVSVGLSQLGTPLKKEVPYAYVGCTSDGTMLLKVSTTVKGVKKTNVYKINPVQRDVVTNSRFKVSKGLQSVYWDFEIANLEGADFETNVIKVWRLPLNRRK